MVFSSPNMSTAVSRHHSQHSDSVMKQLVILNRIFGDKGIKWTIP